MWCGPGQKVAPPPFNDRCVAVSGRCGSACDDDVVDMHRQDGAKLANVYLNLFQSIG